MAKKYPDVDKCGLFSFAKGVTVFGVVVALSCLAACVQISRGNSPMPVAKMLSLLASDNFTQKEKAEFQQFVEMREKAYPTLCKELQTNTDDLQICQIIGFFLMTPGDKTLPLATMRKVLKNHRSNSQSDSNIRSYIAEAFGKIGGREELPLLHGLLKDSSEDVQMASVLSLEQIGNEKSTKAIAVWLANRVRTNNPSFVNHPASLENKAKAVIAAIHERLSTPNEQKQEK